MNPVDEEKQKGDGFKYNEHHIYSEHSEDEEAQ
jgi:hypothetical protein